MNSRELVKAAIAHRKTECTPYCFNMVPEAWEKYQDIAEGATQEEFLDNDVAKVAPPWWQWGDLAADWGEFEPPTSRAKVCGRGGYEEFSDNIKRIKDNSDKYILVTIYGSHFEKAYFSRGIENFLADMAGAPEFARKLLNTIVDKNMVMLDNFLTMEEIDGVLLGSDWGSQQSLLMSPTVWEEMIRPGEQKEYDIIHACGKDVWVHSCGNIESIIPSLIEMGLDVLNPVQPEAMDIAMLKKEFGDKLTFWGGLSTQKTLPFGSPEDVKREARELRDLMGASGGFIFSPAQAIQEDVPKENFLALLEVAREQRT